MSRDDRRCDPNPLVQWLGWHLVELSAVAVPLVLAAVVSAWIALAAVVVAGAWSVHEVRVARRRRALSGPARPSVTGPDAGAGAPPATSDNTSEASA